MLAIAPDLLADVAAGRRVAIVSATNGKTTTTRLLAEALRAERHARSSRTTPAPTCPRASPPRSAATATASVAVLEVDERWVPKVVDPLGDRAARARQPHARPARPLRRGAQHRHPMARRLRDPPRPRGRGQRLRSRTSCGRSARRAASRGSRSARRGDPTRRRVPSARRSSRGPPTASTARRAASPSPTPTTGSTATRCITPDGPVELGLALPGDWNRMNAGARAHGRDHPLRRRRRAARSPACARSRWCRVGSRRCGSPTAATPAVLLAKNPAGWTEVLRWLEPHASSVVLAVNAHVADGRDPSWLWDVPYEMLRGKAVAASGERALDVAVRLDYGGVDHRVERDPVAAAALLPGDVHVIASYTQFTHLTAGHLVSDGSTLGGPRRARLPRAARHLRRPRQRGRAGRAVPAPRHRRRAGGGPGRRAAARRRSTSTCSAAARTTRR